MKYLILRDDSSVKVEEDFWSHLQFRLGFFTLHVEHSKSSEGVESLVFFNVVGGDPVAYVERENSGDNPRDVIKICETEAEAVAFILTR